MMMSVTNQPSCEPRRKRGCRVAPFVLFCCVLCLGMTAVGSTGFADTLTVAAAADLHKAFDQIKALFEKKTGSNVIISYGSSGLLTKQIEQGAPFDLFAAANVKYIDDLIAGKFVRRDSRVLYAQGAITLWTRKDFPVKVYKLQDLLDSRVKHIAIANPEHAPYGQAAQQAMQRVGIWNKVKPKIVYGENISQTLQYAQSGNADVAIVALSLSIGSGGRYVSVPGELYKPLIQGMGIPANSKQVALATRFEKFVMSKTGRSILRRYGFLIPGEKAR